MFGSSSLTDKFKSFDVYRKLPKGYLQPTFVGACLTLVTLGLMIYLFLFEFGRYFNVKTTTQMLVDLSRGSDELIINMNITLNKIPCSVVSLESQDFMGETAMPIQVKVGKFKIEKSGRVLGLYEPPAKKNPHDEATPQPDYEEVKKAFLAEEGCMVAGSVDVLKVPGNIQLSSNAYISIIKRLASDGLYKSDLSHTINHFSFGDHKGIKHIKRHFNSGILDPLDGTSKVHKDTNKIFEYFLNVVPTTYKDIEGKSYHVSQFTANNNMVATDMEFPSITFRYDISPIVVQFSQESQNIFHVFVNICAIFGGMFTLAGILDTILLKFFREPEKTF